MKFTNRLHLAALICAAAASGISHGEVAVSGSARGEARQSVAINGTGLLRGFDLNFGSGQDHHLNTAKVMLSSDDSTVNTGYYDKNFDDVYSYRNSFEVDSDPNLETLDVTGSCRGSCSASINIPSGFAFVLRGFQFSFSSDDHHLRTIGVEPQGQLLRIYMSDKNGDDAFSYRIRYSRVPLSHFVTFRNISGSGIATGTAPIPLGKIVLRGFMLSYADDDHHVSRISVQPVNGQMNIRLHDKNFDDSITYRVQYAQLR